MSERLLQTLAWVLLAAALVGIAAPTFALSENVQDLEESTAFDRIALAQRTARAGPSKVANRPSPVVSISRPRKRSSSRRSTA